MILFSLYSFAIIKEKMTGIHWAGIATGLAGVVCVALK